MQMSIRWLVLLVFLWGVSGGANPSRAAETSVSKDRKTDKKDSARKDRKRDRKDEKEQKKEEKPEVPPVWVEGDGAWSDFLWGVRQMPDFKGLPSDVEEVSLSAVIVKGQEVLFFDQCRMVRKKTFWKMEGCSFAVLGAKAPMSKIVLDRGDSRPDFKALEHTLGLFKKLGDNRKPEELESSLNPSGSKGKSGHVMVDLMKRDQQTCGAKRYGKALKRLPQPTFVGENVALWTLSFRTAQGEKGETVSVGMVKTLDGWKLNELRVHCSE